VCCGENGGAAGAEESRTVILLPKFNRDPFLLPPAFGLPCFCPEVDVGVPVGGRHSITYATCNTLNGRSKDEREETGSATIDPKLNK